MAKRKRKISTTHNSVPDAIPTQDLTFLSKEITRNPQTIRPLSSSLVRRIQALTHSITTDPQEDLEDEALL